MGEISPRLRTPVLYQGRLYFPDKIQVVVLPGDHVLFPVGCVVIQLLQCDVGLAQCQVHILHGVSRVDLVNDVIIPATGCLGDPGRGHQQKSSQDTGCTKVYSILV